MGHATEVASSFLLTVVFKPGLHTVCTSKNISVTSICFPTLFLGGGAVLVNATSLSSKISRIFHFAETFKFQLLILLGTKK